MGGILQFFERDVAGLLVTRGLSVGQSGLRILLVLVIAYVSVLFLRVGVRRLETMLVRAGEKSELVPGATRKADHDVDRGCCSRWASWCCGPSSW